MRFGAKVSRSSILPAFAVAGAGICAALTTNALAEIVWRPILGIEQIFADNVRASADDRDADGITVLSARLRATVQTSHLNAFADVGVSYNEFWATNALDNLNGSGTVAGRGEILSNLLFVDVIGSKQDVYLSPEDVSASGLTTGQGTLQQTDYGVSPFITTEVFGLADLLVRGNYAQVQFDKPVVGIAATLLTDITVKQAGAKITTGQRSSLYEAIGTAEYLETDQGFEQRNVIGGLILNVTGNLSAIGRVGYERISDPSFPVIRGTIWSLGGRFRLGDDSIVQLEYGRRFDDNTYLGTINLALTPYVRVTGNYTDTLTPIQLTLVRSVTDLLNQEGNFVITPPNSPSIPDPLLLDTIVRDKEARLGLAYQKDLRTITLTLGHSDRFFPIIQEDESFYVVGVTVEEQLSRRLEYFVNLQYQDNYATITTRNTTQIYQTDFQLLYQYNQDVTFGGGYTWRLEASPDDVDVYENILRFSVTQAF